MYIEKKITGFIILGMFPQKWTLNGEFNFETDEDKKAFVKKLCECFEYCSDTPIRVEPVHEQSNDSVASTWSPELFFEHLRSNPNTHLGLGDVRLTIGLQEDFIETMNKFYKKRAVSK